MLDPLKSFDTIIENYKRYIKTAFSTRYKDSFEQERALLLDEDGTLYRQPWVEPLPSYLSSEYNISNMDGESTGMDDQELAYFKALVGKGLFPEKNNLYAHQFEMLKMASGQGKNCIITSGTGSGKTEAFLLPVFAALAKEAVAKNWQQEVLPVNNKLERWWRSRGETYTDILDFDNGRLLPGAMQRGHETRTPAVRALILYPMNALVEDQMTRLRVALDSKEARGFFENQAAGPARDRYSYNRIYFGRYNSSTPSPGLLPIIDQASDSQEVINMKTARGQKIVGRLRTKLRKLEEDLDKVARYFVENKGEDEGRRYFFPQLDGAEMFTRFDMQVTPPDILVTNFSMLSIMLMREADSLVFEQTKAWLDEKDSNGKKSNVFHLVIDELHLYRGTQGTEVAYLIRVLLERLGLTPASEQLRILASSASLNPGDKKSLDFLKDFFGVPFEKDQILTGQNIPVAGFAKEEIPASQFELISKAYDESGGDIKNAGFINAILSFTGTSEEELGNGIVERLSRWGINQRFKEVFGESPRAIEAWNPSGNDLTFSGKIFGPGIPATQLKNAARGLFILRGLIDTFKLKDDGKLPRLRFHYFARNVEGLWANADISTVESRFSSRQDTPPNLRRVVGKLSAKPGIIDKSGKRLFDVLYCENCGTTFLGGNRLYENGTLEIITVSPDIEGIPEKSTQAMVERKKYWEYTVFWPEGEQNKGLDIDINYTKDYSCTWEAAFLNKITGIVSRSMPRLKLDEWTRGKLFFIGRSVDGLDKGELIEQPALPCTCPACSSNYSKRKSRTSPVRGFRSGFSKTAEILAKELFYQLPGGSNARKLVLFSDSREDAAQLSNGIERFHFSDLVREAIVQGLYNDLPLNNYEIAREIFQLHAAGQLNGTTLGQLRVNYPANLEIINKLRRLTKDIEDEDALPTERQSAKEELEALANSPYSISLPELASGEGGVKQILIDTGVNPRGCDRNKQSFYDDDNVKYDWDKILVKGETGHLTIDGNRRDWITRLDKDVLQECVQALFGPLYFGLEASGLAYVGLHPALYNEAKKRKLSVDKIHAYIRKLGDNYYYQGSEFPTDGTLGDWNKAVKDFIAVNNDTADSVYALLRSLAFNINGVNTHLLDNKGNLDPSCLGLYPVNDEQATYYECSNCFRPHLHAGTKNCTFCNKPLNSPTKLVSNLWKENFIAYHAKYEKRQPLRLHTEEMTGQTDDQFLRQRHFRDMVLSDEGFKKTKAIDMLSVTTTLEVGVDIGALQAVMLGNMPPQRFNYQQRVGRAGRRGQAFSTVLTFCRGRSHDEHYFNNPSEITGDPPPTPALSVGEERIFKRVLNKYLLSEAFRGKSLARFEESRSTHGELGEPGQWLSNGVTLKNFLSKNGASIAAAFVRLAVGTNFQWPGAFETYYLDTERDTSFFKEVSAKALDNRLPGTEVADRLAEGGMLPMFGMPSSVKELYHGFNTGNMEMQSIDRDQSLAISEFSPGSQKTKDKAIITAIGITPPLSFSGAPAFAPSQMGDTPAFLYTGYMVRCPSCNFLSTERVEINFDVETLESPKTIECTSCGKHADRFPMVIPAAYRTDFEQGKDSKDGSDVSSSRPPVYALPSSGEVPGDGHNYKKMLSPSGITWRVNTNDNNFFTLGRQKAVRVITQKNGNSYIHELTDQWISGNVSIKRGFDRVDNLGRSVTTSFAANKTTEIFRLEPKEIIKGLYGGMFDGSLQSSGVKSAVYSAAFLIQRAIAVDLDVDPTEIEIADTRKSPSGYPVIALADELPNGSGFTRKAFENFEDLVRKRIYSDIFPSNKYFTYIRGEQHGKECETACYKCLKVFRNMSYHGLLDWRLGYAWLELLTEQDFLCGLDGVFEKHVSMKDWPRLAGEIAKSLCDAFQGIGLSNYEGKLHGFVAGGHPVIIIHPLWDFTKLQEPWIGKAKLALEEELRGKGASSKTLTIDTFNGLRRPAKCKSW
ncbi:DEAD/DEAH box helicase [Mucilaginibacter sp. Mucisp84]|uniref:DEAD/DEAH box helicase n=1 Tax=Mucilaginibacter sp. Mucisp84 TaxID=3243058 RepID=UPI0039A54772